MVKISAETVTKFRNMKIIQRNDYQNFTLDSVLLGDFVKINRKIKRILDIGTGCGILPIILYEKSKSNIIGVEIQKVMSEIAKKNIENNNLSDRIEITHKDIKEYKNIFKKDEFDSIVTNPPYFEFKGDIDQINNLEQIAKARHNIDITIEEIIKISSYLLINKGYFSMVFRSERLVEILTLMKEYKLIPKRMKNVYTKRDENAKICLVEGIKDAKDGFEIESPIYIYDENNEKSEYVKKLYENII